MILHLYLANLDHYADYIPVLSTVTNIVAIFLRCLGPKAFSKDTIQYSPFLAQVMKKEYSRSIPLLIPIIGQIYVFLMPTATKKIKADIEKNESFLYCITNKSTKTFCYLSLGVGYIDGHNYCVLQHEVNEVSNDMLFKPGEQLILNEGHLEPTNSRGDYGVTTNKLAGSIFVRELGSMNVTSVPVFHLTNNITFYDSIKDFQGKTHVYFHAKGS